MTNKDYDISDFNKAITALQKQINTLPIVIGDYVVDEFKNNFERKAFFNAVWKASILPDTMNKSGNLKSSIKLKTASMGEIKIESDTPYSRIHNEGGKIKKTEKMIKFFWAMYKKEKHEFWKRLAISKNQYIEIPQRQFMGDHPMLRNGIEKEIIKHIQKAFK